MLFSLLLLFSLSFIETRCPCPYCLNPSEREKPLLLIMAFWKHMALWQINLFPCFFWRVRKFRIHRSISFTWTINWLSSYPHSEMCSLTGCITDNTFTSKQFFWDNSAVLIRIWSFAIFVKSWSAVASCLSRHCLPTAFGQFFQSGCALAVFTVLFSLHDKMEASHWSTLLNLHGRLEQQLPGGIRDCLCLCRESLFPPGLE